MLSLKKISVFAITIFSVLVLAGGCGPGGQVGPVEIEKEKPIIELALKYQPGDVTTYKVVTEKGKSIEFSGVPSKDVKFENARNYHKMELVFEQRIVSIDTAGIARVAITLKELLYQRVHKNNTLMDYDSKNPTKKGSAFGNLIGQRYTIWLSPAGEVTKIANISKARAAAAGRSMANRMALSILEEDQIKWRHSVKGLGACDKKQVRTGQQWSETEDISFDLMGSKSYEKIYTLQEVRESDGRKMAVIEMETIPSSESAGKLHKQEEENAFKDMFDSIDRFDGRIELDLSSGRVEKCSENLYAKWIIINPSSKVQKNKEPSTLTMMSVRSYSLERIK